MSRARRQAYTARDIIMADLGNPPRIADLAEMVGLSQRRLNEAFRLVFDASPVQCLMHWRLDMAYRLLATGELTVKQVAHRAGYAHVKQFLAGVRAPFRSSAHRYAGRRKGLPSISRQYE